MNGRQIEAWMAGSYKGGIVEQCYVFGKRAEAKKDAGETENV